MGTEVDIFSSKLPEHVTNAKSKAMQAMGSGIAGGGFGNRISLRNSKFRFIQNGEAIGTHTEATLEVVVFALAANVQRMYFEGAYVDGNKEPPTCFSHDGKVPSPESPQVQSPQCATCPKNVKGSGRMANTKACAYKKRVIVMSPDDLEGPAFSLDVSGQSMFGEQDESKNLYSFKGFYEKLVAHNMDISAIVTRLAFDDSASVPKLHFSPVRALSAEEFALVQGRMDDEDVTKMLKDMTNVSEGDEVAPLPVKVAAPKVEPPKPEPVVTKPKGFGGNGAGKSVSGTVALQGPTPAPTTQTKTIQVDLSKLTNFDD